eukprot:scaffold476996_cov15-Prasinocladus_malaysianus.AAC.1
MAVAGVDDSQNTFKTPISRYLCCTAMAMNGQGTAGRQSASHTDFFLMAGGTVRTNGDIRWD